MTLADKLEATLPADGSYTKDQQLIAEAVGELRAANERGANHRRIVMENYDRGIWLGGRRVRKVNAMQLTLALITGLALGLVAGGLW